MSSLRRTRRRPFWTYPVAFGAAIYAVIQAEKHSRFIWRGLVKRTMMQQLLAYLDQRFPPRNRMKARSPHGHSAE